MKLYFPLAPTATLPSIWSAAGYPITTPCDSNQGKVWMSQLSDFKPLPFYPLQLTPPSSKGNLSFSGQGVHTALTFGQYDFDPTQQFILGAAINRAGIIPKDIVLSLTFLAYSGRNIVSWMGTYRNATLSPAFVYVYRPSTNSIVGVVAKGPFGNISKLASSTLINSYVGGNGPGGTVDTTSWRSCSPEFSTAWTYYDVTAAVGDLLCWEMWGTAWSTLFDNQTITWSITLDVGWNGTTGTDQVFNKAGNIDTVRGYNNFFYWDDLAGLTQTNFSGPGPFAAPNLITVTPMTGPVLRLEFDNPVGITGPTITGPVDGLGVTGATQISTVLIDLACAIRPDHPDGDANNATLVPPIGEADPLGPPVPTGVGATVI